MVGGAERNRDGRHALESNTIEALERVPQIFAGGRAVTGRDGLIHRLLPHQRRGITLDVADIAIGVRLISVFLPVRVVDLQELCHPGRALHVTVARHEAIVDVGALRTAEGPRRLADSQLLAITRSCH